MKAALVIIATVLSAFNGFLSMLSVLVFSSHESGTLWASIYLPTTLWLIALSCFRYPRVGAVAFCVVWFACVVLCFGPIHHSLHESGWKQCADNLSFALFAGVLLLINTVISKQSSEATASM